MSRSALMGTGSPPYPLAAYAGPPPDALSRPLAGRTFAMCPAPSSERGLPCSSSASNGSSQSWSRQGKACRNSGPICINHRRISQDHSECARGLTDADDRPVLVSSEAEECEPTRYFRGVLVMRGISHSAHLATRLFRYGKSTASVRSVSGQRS